MATLSSEQLILLYFAVSTDALKGDAHPPANTTLTLHIRGAIAEITFIFSAPIRRLNTSRATPL
ncbi:hypothetical protein [Mesorhizobium sp. M00.F.Ca.ET.216.01.1.1]|uniref:hypothetical protein n=1 Tax=Mesorhizobium sp. M00.F.Ca.ET.216.01.1.1 TaxID=2500528 RepID=UPI0016743EF7|nr:hypothetical protein [Mesorhizobium sp. M00.F.Ca.ET.216.01.1.1]